MPRTPSIKVDVVRALKDERRGLAERLRAVDLALEAFGVAPGTRGPDLRPRRAGTRAEVERKLRETIAALDRRGQPWSRKDIITLADVPVSGGTTSRALRALVDEGLLVQRGRTFYLPDPQPAELRIRAGEGVIAQ